MALSFKFYILNYFEVYMKRIALIVMVLVVCNAAIASAVQKEQRTKGQAAIIDFVLYDSNYPHIFKVDVVSASGDCLISKDETTQATIDANFVDRGSFYSIALTATEMDANRIFVTVADQSSPKLWMDHAISIDVNIQTELAAIKTKIYSAVDSNGDVTLRATGLNKIPITDPNHLATTYPESQVLLYRNFFGKVARVPGYIYWYNDAGVASIKQEWSNDGTNLIIDDANNN